VRNLVFILIWLLVPLSAAATSPSDPFDSIQLIDQVEFVVSNAELPPSDDADWQPAELPRGSRVGTRQDGNRIWYRFVLPPPPDEDIYSLYFWRYNLNLSVFLNDTYIGGDSYRAGRTTVAWNTPLLVDMQPSSWRSENNLVHIRYNFSDFGGTFSEVRFGKRAELFPVYEDRLFWNIRTNEWLLAFGIFIALLVLGLWALRPGDTIYAWFLGVCVCWSFLSIHMVLYYNPLPYELWLPLVHIALDGWVFSLFGFVNRLLKLNFVKTERVLLVIFAIAILSHLFSPRMYFWMMAYSFHLVGLSVILFLTVKIITQARHSQVALLICAALAAQLALSGHDLWMFFYGDQETWRSAVHVSHFGLPLILAVFAVQLLLQFTGAPGEAEKLNLELEDRVATSRDKLEQTYQRNRELELDRAAAEERQKIYRDIHDDVGSTLVSMLHSNDPDSFKEQARSALESVREAVYRANYRDEPMLDFLLRLRQEQELRVESAGFEFSWYEDPDIPNDKLVASQCYNLGRILREVVSNALSHSRASQLHVNIEKLNGQYLLEVNDNGIGLQAPGAGSSGLSNIEYRAAAMDATFTWENSAEGLTIRLLFYPDFRSSAAETV